MRVNIDAFQMFDFWCCCCFLSSDKISLSLPPFCLHEADRYFGVVIECVAAIHITGS